jgi:hypothetical protein
MLCTESLVTGVIGFSDTTSPDVDSRVTPNQALGGCSRFQRLFAPLNG